jgi:hypothetical protein
VIDRWTGLLDGVVSERAVAGTGVG